MFDYGNGSDGALNVTSGITTLALDTKHQFTTVDVALVGQLKGVGNGSVLYITATEHIKINGTLTTFGIVDPGQNTWSATIDGVTFNSPSAANGGKGGNNASGAVGGSQGAGFGGGGAGGYVDYFAGKGGNGGNGGSTPGSGGAGVSANGGWKNGNNGGISAGGSGVAAAYNGTSITSGKGGNAYSGNGSTGPGDGGNNYSGGGGGAGGLAGRPGVHIVLKAPLIEINRVVMTSGAIGGTGGNGGNASAHATKGSGGGGGGGGNAGNIYIYTENLVENAPIYTMAGGDGGAGGTGYQAGSAGSPGAPGQKIVHIDTGLIQGVAKVWNGTAWQPSVVKRLYEGQWLDSSVKYYEDI